MLMLRGDRTWRKQIVNIGLVHLVMSLLSLLVAFTFAGFIVAGVKTSPCDIVPCGEAGIPCSAFTVVNKTNDGVIRQLPWVPRTLTQDLVRLNNATFGNVALDAVTCQDYSYVANGTRVAYQYPLHFPAGAWGAPFEGGEAQNATHNVIKQPCLMVLSEFIFANQSLFNDTTRIASLGHEVINPNAYAMWCTTDGAPVDLGWLPIKLQHAADLAGLRKLTAGRKLDASGYTLDSADRCPAAEAYNKSANVTLRNGICAIPLLAGVASPWQKNSFADDYLTFDDKERSKVCAYAIHMGWDGKGALKDQCGSDNMAETGTGHAEPSEDQTPGPLAPAHYMPALRYQCSGIQNGYLCDYEASPPCAVDGTGHILTWSQLVDLNQSIALRPIDAKTTRIYIAVITMASVAVIANLGTLIFFACKRVEPGRSWAYA